VSTEYKTNKSYVLASQMPPWTRQGLRAAATTNYLRKFCFWPIVLKNSVGSGLEGKSGESDELSYFSSRPRFRGNAGNIGDVEFFNTIGRFEKLTPL